MKQKNTHAGDGNLAINAAKSFFALAGTFFKELPFDPVARASYLRNPTSIGMLIAATTNLAFSVELFLKAIAIKTCGRAKDGHKLIDQFTDLPSDVQASIDQCYRYRLKHGAHQEFPQIELSVSPHNREPSEEEKKTCRLNNVAGEDVRSLLEAEKDAFQIWRYLCERARPTGPACVTVHYYQMGALVNAIEDQFVPPHERPNYQRPR